MEVNTKGLKSLVEVHLPCFASSEGAFRLLGGEAHVKEAITKKADKLNLKWAVRDPLRHSIAGKRRVANGMLLRVRRPMGREAERGGDTAQVTCLGLVQTTYKFNDSADYQFLPESTLVDLKHEQSLGSTVLQAIPRPLSAVEMAASQVPKPKLKGIFVETAAKRDVKRPVKGDRKTKVTTAVNVRYGDDLPEVPMPPCDERIHSGKYALILQAMFKRRPGYTLKALKVTGAFRGEEALLIELLKGTAYRFTSGPWENVWFRHGYSPLAHPDARFLQVITVAPGASALEAVVKTASSQLGDRLSRTTLVNLHSLSVWDMPWGLHTKSGEAVDCFLFHEAFNRHTKTIQVQLCDVMDQGVHTHIELHAPRLAACSGDPRSPDVGWYTQETFTSLQETVSQAFSRRMALFAQCHLRVVTPSEARRFTRTVEGDAIRLIACADLASGEGGVHDFEAPPAYTHSWLPCEAPAKEGKARADFFDVFGSLDDYLEEAEVEVQGETRKGKATAKEVTATEAVAFDVME